MPLAKVYPRGGGGTAADRRPSGRFYGLSPRGRGNPVIRSRGWLRDRSIPAGAGEPPLAVVYDEHHAVYPRGGGGTLIKDWERLEKDGLSPRGRGNRDQAYPDLVGDRSIPAGAGEPLARRPLAALAAVYPRGGGGTR